MAFSVDRYLFKRYDKKAYNCRHFAREVWLELTGEDIAERITFFWDDPDKSHIAKSDVQAFRRLHEPCNPCLAMMRNPKSPPHLGIYLDGRILHLDGDGAYYIRPEVVRQFWHSLTYFI